MPFRERTAGIGPAFKRLRGRRFVKIVSWAGLALMPAYYTLMLEWFNFGHFTYVKTFIAERGPSFVFSLLLIYLVCAGLFLMLGRAWAAALACGGLFALVSLVNYIKFALTGDNFFPLDIVMAGNAGEIVGFVSMSIPWAGIFLLVLTVLSVLFFVLFGGKLRLRFFIRIPAGLLIFAGLVVFFSDAARAEKIFNKFNIRYESGALQESNYRENGFVGAFAVNLAQFAVSPPKECSKAELEALLGEYTAEAPAEGFAYPDIIVVLSESFWDPRLLPGSEFSENPLKNFDRLAASENGVSGNLLVPVMGGGTVRTEFELLTGLTTEALPGGLVPYNILKNPVDSFVSYYKGLGYDAIAMHTYHEKFYSRDKAMPLLGFDAYWGIEKLETILSVEAKVSGRVTGDKSFEEYIEYFLNEAEEPLFLFGISMENHGSYWGKYPEPDINAENPALSSSDLTNFKNYVQGIKNADEALGALADFIDSRERPTAVLWFGDHLPSLGVSYSSYIASGFIETPWRPEDYIKMYSPPYIIYANFPFLAEAPSGYISVYHALNALSAAIGAGKTPYMAFLEDFYKAAPYYGTRLKQSTDGIEGFIAAQKRMTYELMISGK